MQLARTITAVDCHCAGEPGRVITGGVVNIPGETVLDKKLWLENNDDQIRKLMLREPRGYPALCCNLVVPSNDPKAAAGFIIMEHTEYPAMSGANTICVVTALLETGMLPMKYPETKFMLEAPAGLVGITARCEPGKVRGVTFENLPAFVTHLDEEIEVPHLGRVKVDVAWGGMMYVIAEAEPLGIELKPENGREVVRVTEMIRAAAAEQLPAIHPGEPLFSGVNIGQLTAPSPEPGVDRINAVTVPTRTLDWDDPQTWTGVLDRSPCGTGTCAAMARLHARGELEVGRDFIHQSIIGTLFTGRLKEETEVEGVPAVVPTVTGQAWIYGLNQYLLDPTDPFPEGFEVGDIW